MKERLHQLAEVRKRLWDSIRNLELYLSRYSNAAGDLRPLIAQCSRALEKVDDALRWLKEGPYGAFHVDWDLIRQLAGQGRNQIQCIRDVASPSSPLTRSLKDLSLILIDLEGIVSAKIGVAISEEKATMDAEIRESLSKLWAAIKQHTQSFVRTTPFASISVDGKVVDFDLKDLLLLGALTHADVLLVGKTGPGSHSGHAHPLPGPGVRD